MSFPNQTTEHQRLRVRENRDRDNCDEQKMKENVFFQHENVPGCFI